MNDPDSPPLHPIVTGHIPPDSWIPCGMEPLPPGWVNVRIWSYDEVLGRELYIVEDCPGILHTESTVTHRVIQLADDDGELFSEWGDPYDSNPIIIDIEMVDPPRKHSQYVDPDWRPAYVAGGYLGTCQADGVAELLAEHGFADAIPRGETRQ